MVKQIEKPVKASKPGTPAVRAFVRGLDIIRALGGRQGGMSLSEVARAVELDRATTRRFLLTLLSEGYLRLEGRTFFLAPKVLDLGYAYLASSPLREIAVPYLKQVAAETRQGCSFGILDDNDVLYLGSEQSASRIIGRQIGAGVRLPAYCTSIGRIVLGSLASEELEAYGERVRFVRHTAHTLTYWPDIRKAVEAGRAQGWVFVDQELEDGLRSLAVPVKDRNSRIVAGINVSALASRLESKSDIAKSLKTLQRAALGIEQALRLR
ncbi:MAG: IclR family transcriptional regulator C-terminal domain-containing protein [Reyranellaceae bacterium]